MRCHRPKVIVRIAAVTTAFLALWALGILLFKTSQLIIHEADSPRYYRDLGVLSLFAILPLMFIWASIQAWRCVPSGVVSIGSGWIVFGLAGGIFSLFWFLTDWRLRDAIGAFMWTGVFLFGVWVAKQERRIANGAA